MKQYYVAVLTKEISEAVQTYLFSLGKEWYGTNTRSFIESSYDKSILGIHFSVSSSKLGYSPVDWYKNNGYTEVTLSQLQELLGDKRIVIGEHYVKFDTDFIKVGCQKVSHKTIVELYNRIRKEGSNAVSEKSI